MVNKRFWLGILVMVFGMLVVGCEEEARSVPYSQSIMISLMGSSWDSSTPTKGSVEIKFEPPVQPVSTSSTKFTGTPAKVSVEDLQWLETSGINLELSNANSRTISITTIEKKGWDDSVFVKLNLTRSAVPPTVDEKLDYGTATVLITLPNDFTAKYPDGITWGKKDFQF